MIRALGSPAMPGTSGDGMLYTDGRIATKIGADDDE